jgi:hypothetical protein
MLSTRSCELYLHLRFEVFRDEDDAVAFSSLEHSLVLYGSTLAAFLRELQS